MKLIRRKRVEDALYEITAVVEKKVAMLRVLEKNVPRRENEIQRTIGELEGLSQAARIVLARVK